MTNHKALLRGAALGVLAFAVAGVANAAPKKHHHAAAYGAAPSTGSEISELRAEVQALKAQNDALAQNQAAIQAQVAQTQAQTAQIAADAESVQDRLDSVPQQVLTVVGELPKPKPSWADKTQIGSVVFLDASGISQKSNGKSVTPSGTALDIKRAYITIDHQFNDVYSASLTTDFQYIRALNGVGSLAAPAVPGAITTANLQTQSATATNELFLKKAYLQAKYASWFTVRLGGADTPWIPFAESVEGNRYVENVLIDRTKFGNSADWGLHILGTFAPIGDPKTGPVVSYQVSAVDGAGFRTPPGTNSAPRTDDFDVEGRVSVKWYDFTAGIGGLTGRLGQQAGFQFNAGSNAPVIYRDASRFDAILGYNNGTVKLGVEYFTATNYSAAALTNATTGDKADGYEVFGGYTFDPQWSIFGRYDYVKPNKTTASTKKDNYYNLGVTYEPVKIVDLSLVYKRDKVDNGTLSTSNGTIGGSTDGTYDEIGLFGQFRF